MKTSQKIKEKAIEAGADIIELGIPFSDPMADGPVIQKALQIAIRAGVDLNRILDMVESVFFVRQPIPSLLSDSAFRHREMFAWALYCEDHRD